MSSTRTRARLAPHLPAALPGLAAVALMLIWAVHNGGYDAETWYWGALASLGLLAAVIVGLRDRLRLTRGRLIAIGLFALYVAWCYLSMAWAQSPGDALQGANQALLYLLMAALLLVLPWTPPGALAALLVFTGGVGVIAIVLMIDLATSHNVASLVVEGRLSAPTGYINSSAALFTMGTLAATVLASRRELPGPLRGLLITFACCDLQLALIVQSRGWLFTLALVALAAIVVAPDRLRVAIVAAFPVLATVAVIHRLLDVFQSSGATTGLNHAASAAGHPALLVDAAALVVGTVLAWADSLWPTPPLSRVRRRVIGTTLSVTAVLIGTAAAVALTHGHPLRFVVRQWNGFSHVQTSFSSQSHFGDVGSGRYDFWRVALDAFLAHPVGGLGEDNFADYYVVHRHTYQEPSWTHSLEMRLLAQTGLVGFALFAGFLIVALTIALRARRTGDPVTRVVAGIALLPLMVWLIHGSLDWFWEMPALSGPALGFLAMAASLAPERPKRAPGSRAGVGAVLPAPRPVRRQGAAVAGLVLALVAGVVVLGVPYLSVREVSLGSNASATNSRAALDDLATAASLNPLSAVPGRLAGAIALQIGDYRTAEARFDQSVAREPGGWFSWLGAGLAASAQGDPRTAHRDFARADRINSQQPAVTAALHRVYGRTPLTSAQAFNLLVLVQ